MSASAIAPTPDRRKGAWTIGAIGSAHFTSHFLQLSIAPLLPILHDELGVDFIQLGFILTVFYTASGAGQVLSGMLVDRFGAHRLLVGGMLLQAISFAAMGLSPGYATLIPLAAMAGLGNSVYHPADLSILSSRVNPAYLGRAFAVHSMAGAAGFASGPLVTGIVGENFGWRAALILAGGFGVLMATFLAFSRPLRLPSGARSVSGATEVRPVAALNTDFLQIVLMPVMLTGFAYFLLTSFAESGIQSFSITVLAEGYGTKLALATGAVTAYQLGSAGGVLSGGYIADRTSRYERVAATGLVLSALFMFTVAYPALPIAAIIILLACAGFSSGATKPARDLLIRHAAPSGGLGKAFGVVYSGLDVGSLLAPVAYGALLDRNLDNLVFVVSGAVMLLATFTIFQVYSRATRQRFFGPETGPPLKDKDGEQDG
jgi:MFS family permease